MKATKKDEIELKKDFENFKKSYHYEIERNDFVNIFKVLVLNPNYKNIIFPEYESSNFKTWKYKEEFYILYKPTGVLINWCNFENIGITYSCNKNLILHEYVKFVMTLIDELDDVLLDISISNE